MKLTGIEAIEYAEANGLTLNKYNDPTEDAREGLTPEEARKIAREDSGLIYVEDVEQGMTHRDVQRRAAKSFKARVMGPDPQQNPMGALEFWSRR
jgi:hypothetical protein